MDLRFEHISGRHLSWLKNAGVVNTGNAQLPVEMLESETCHAVLASLRDNPRESLGVLLYSSEGELLKLDYLFVTEPRRRQGIARRLIIEAVESPINLLVSKIGLVAGTKDGQRLLSFLKQLPFQVNAIPYPWN